MYLIFKVTCPALHKARSFVFQKQKKIFSAQGLVLLSQSTTKPVYKE